MTTTKQASAKSDAKVTTADVASASEELREQKANDAARGASTSPASDVPNLYDAERERTAEYVRLVQRVGPELERIRALKEQGVDTSIIDNAEVKANVERAEKALKL